MPLRVGESFVTDANRFAQAALYATDMGTDVIQEALGTYNAPYFARQAIEYAYNHGTTVIASAADEAAGHHNQPGALPDTIVVNSVNQPDSIGGFGATNVPPSYLQLNGCTNFGPRVTLAVEGSSCSSITSPATGSAQVQPTAPLRINPSSAESASQAQKLVSAASASTRGLPSWWPSLRLRHASAGMITSAAALSAIPTGECPGAEPANRLITPSIVR